MEEITKREILLGIGISVVLFLFGLWVADGIREASERKYLLFLQALKTEDSGQFQYGIKTNVGDVLAYGELTANDKQTTKDIKGEYGYIQVIEEEYTRHTRQVAYSCGENQTCYRTEVYYTWDYNGSEEWATSGWSMLAANVGRVCRIPEYTVNLDTHYTGKYKHDGRYAYPDKGYWTSVGDKRYYWQVADTKYNGTVFVRAVGNTLSSPTHDCIQFYNASSIDNVVDGARPHHLAVMITTMVIVTSCIGVYFLIAKDKDIV